MERWQRIDHAPEMEARQLLFTCCGSNRWVARMLARRPFGDPDSVLAAARHEWYALSTDDWREAFRQHPRIGDAESLRSRFPETRHLSSSEQAAVAASSGEVLAALAKGNDEYEAKFGYIFIVCATGKSAEEMLAILRARLPNDPVDEIRIAAEEQAKIAGLRLTG